MSNNKTVKRRHTPVNTVIIRNFLEMLQQIKLFHWNTFSYAEHKASDELYTKLNDNIDKFVEVWLGKYKTRIGRIHYTISSTNSTMKPSIERFKEFLLDLKLDNDLANIRDEIVADLNQFLYLLSLK
jgi:DNA-binding ferritin-like protein